LSFINFVFRFINFLFFLFVTILLGHLPVFLSQKKIGHWNFLFFLSILFLFNTIFSFCHSTLIVFYSSQFYFFVICLFFCLSNKCNFHQTFFFFVTNFLKFFVNFLLLSFTNFVFRFINNLFLNLSQFCWVIQNLLSFVNISFGHSYFFFPSARCLGSSRRTCASWPSSWPARQTTLHQDGRTGTDFLKTQTHFCPIRGIDTLNLTSKSFVKLKFKMTKTL